MFDIKTFIQELLLHDHREGDGLLHPSSHLSVPLRRVQLELASAPRKSFEADTPTINIVKAKTGTLWHSYLEDRLRDSGLPVFTEVDVSPGLPPGWSGTADILVWTPEGFLLVDLKTTSDKSVAQVRVMGPKVEHQRQVTAYYLACKKMNLPMLDSFIILYMSTDAGDDPFYPVECLPVDGVYEQMEEIGKRVERYKDEVRKTKSYINNELAGHAVEEESIYYNKYRNRYDVYLGRPWSCAYCPIVDELCNCGGGKQRVTIGYYKGNKFNPAEGYEDYEPEILPPL